jgi:dTDP-4-dehydrorhamnose reductase
MSSVVLGDGLLGKEIVNQTNWDFVSRKKDNIDANNPDSIFNLILQYDTIINCIANTDTYSTDKKNHWSVNYKFVSDLIEFCNFQNKKLIHISTDYLYSNSVSKASEDDVPVHLGTWYGYTKLLGDSLVQLKCNDHLICRLSHKPYPFPYDKAWVDIKTNGDYVTVIADLVIKLIKNNSFGVYNVGTEEKSIYDLAIKTRKVDPIKKPDYIPYDTTMSLDKLKKVL